MAEAEETPPPITELDDVVAAGNNEVVAEAPTSNPTTPPPIAEQNGVVAGSGNDEVAAEAPTSDLTTLSPIAEPNIAVSAGDDEVSAKAPTSDPTTPPPIEEQNSLFADEPAAQAPKSLLPAYLGCCFLGKTTLIIIAALLILVLGAVTSVLLVVEPFTDAPTEAPSLTPSISPTAVPSTTPSETPSTIPSEVPSTTPSVLPSVSVGPSPQPSTSPTSSPTSSPTIEPLPFIPVNAVPDPRPRGYFNYDQGDSQFGPEAWRRINMDGTYFEEFGRNGYGVWKGYFTNHLADSTSNLCSVRGKQSPIDLRQSGGEGGKCTAVHQIRSRGASHRLNDPQLEKLIEPNKLRLVFPRRPCLNLDDNGCWAGRPPLADFPNWSSSQTHFSDMLNLDIKVPGEHKINGEEFDAEMQLLHLHLTDQRMGLIGVPIRAKVGGFNREYQDLLDQFQRVYDGDKADCSAKRRRLRGKQAPSFRNQTESIMSVKDDPDSQRRLQEKFDPYSDFLKTIYFYRYHGSNTEPPCFPITWFVMTSPLVISLEQLRQTKSLIFTHEDGNCRKTSVHNNEQSVARPIQDIANDPATQQPRPIMFCEEDDFDPDR